MKSKIHLSQLIFISLMLIFLSACNSTQFLKDDEAYLIENEIKFDKKQAGKVKNKSNLIYDLGTLAKQKPNENFFFIPRQNFWYRSTDSIGRYKLWHKLGQPLAKRLGEIPAIYDENKAQESTESMVRYLNERGYFQAEVSFYTKYKKKGKKVEVVYEINPRKQYFVDTLIYETRDTNIQKILSEIRPESLFPKGEPVDANLHFQETNRITNHLRNNGYYYFSNAYFDQLVGKDSADSSVKLELGILLPKSDSLHQTYHIGNITIFQQSKFGRTFLPQPDTLINGIWFATNGEEFRVKPNILTNSITLKKGKLYSKNAESSTLRNLNRLGVFSFVTINAIPRIGEDILDFEIFLSPNKKWRFGIDWDANFSERRNVGATTSLLGLSLNPSLATRNFRSGAESLVFNADFGVEIDPFADRFSVINNLDFKIQSDWNFPRFIDYFGFWRGLNKLNLVSDNYMEGLKGKAISGITTSYNWQILIDRYQLYLGNLSFGYSMQRSPRSYFEVNNAGIEVLIPIIDPTFNDEILKENPFLQQSFTDQLFTGILLRDFNYFYTGGKSSKGHFWSFIGNFEISGLEIWAANKIRNSFNNDNVTFDFFGTEFSQFIRLNLDLRRNWHITPTRQFVVRANSGIVVPFGFSETAPYVKQFFVGGPQSLRGWHARAIGPGSFLDPLALDPNNRNLFYQTGDFKLELNLEYRFPLVKVIYPVYGAAFLDIGNIWSLGFTPNDERNDNGAILSFKREFNEDGQITNDVFYKEMAVSGGFGLRADLSYFVFRLDFGTPIKNNYPDVNRNNSYWVDFSKWQFKDVIWNLGLGYPF